ncbi:MAG: hypothetical protein KIT69_11240 [Propionibacteriaceae bacterium]|nr:hypothetical protein [Propionibacteriaceae bacterium]
MRRGQLLNPALAEAIALLGHGDLVLVVDAGFPIPDRVRRIDLSLEAGVPSIEQVLTVLLRHVFAERLLLPDEARAGNPRHYARLLECFRGSGAVLEVVPHDRFVEQLAPSARLVVRSGDFEAWGSAAFVASTEPQAWFTESAIREGLVVPDSYRARIDRMAAGGPPVEEPAAPPGDGEAGRSAPRADTLTVKYARNTMD